MHFLSPCPKTRAREKVRLIFRGICSAAFVREIKRDLLMAAIDPCLIQLHESLSAIGTLICMAAHPTNRRSPRSVWTYLTISLSHTPIKWPVVSPICLTRLRDGKGEPMRQECRRS